MKFAQMDVFEMSGYYEEWFVFLETSPVNFNFEEMGMGDRNFVMNSGSFFLIVLFFAIEYVFNEGILKYISKWMAHNKTIRTVLIKL